MFPEKFKPMLAGKFDPAKQKWPVLASPKIDGIRALITAEGVFSRSLKKLPNAFVQATLSDPELVGLDGEIIVGEPNAPDVYARTESGIMSKGGEPVFQFIVFDCWDEKSADYELRYKAAREIADDLDTPYVKVLPQRLIHDQEELDEFEAECLDDGYEGVMIRSLYGPYKCGRSTTNEGYLLKVKRYETDEATVIGVVEEFRNDNEATVDALGHTKRSSHQENKVGKNRLGSLVVRCLETGAEFQVGSGFNAKEREELWASPPIGRNISYNHFAHGRKDAPRHPVFKGFRDPSDMGEPTDES